MRLRYSYSLKESARRRDVDCDFYYEYLRGYCPKGVVMYPQVRKNDPNRLVHREGKTVTVAFVQASYDQLHRSAQSLRAEHFSARNGWDNWADWLAFMLLIMNAEMLTGKQTISIPNDAANLNPNENMYWAPSEGRAKRERNDYQAKAVQQSASLAFASMPSMA